MSAQEYMPTAVAMKEIGIRETVKERCTGQDQDFQGGSVVCLPRFFDQRAGTLSRNANFFLRAESIFRFCVSTFGTRKNWTQNNRPVMVDALHIVIIVLTNEDLLWIRDHGSPINKCKHKASSRHVHSESLLFTAQSWLVELASSGFGYSTLNNLCE